MQQAENFGLEVSSPTGCSQHISYVLAQPLDCGVVPAQDCGYSTNIRVTDRAQVFSAELAQLLFERTRHYISNIECISDAANPRGCRRTLNLECTNQWGSIFAFGCAAISLGASLPPTTVHAAITPTLCLLRAHSGGRVLLVGPLAHLHASKPAWLVGTRASLQITAIRRVKIAAPSRPSWCACPLPHVQLPSVGWDSALPPPGPHGSCPECDCLPVGAECSGPRCTLTTTSVVAQQASTMKTRHTTNHQRRCTWTASLSLLSLSDGLGASEKLHNIIRYKCKMRVAGKPGACATT